MVNYVFVNTLNNFSGAPKVLSILIREIIKKGYSATLLTSSGPGFLTGIFGLKYLNNGYRWSRSKLLMLFFWAWSQMVMFFRILWMPRKNTCYYINTITPIGAVWACWLTRKRMIYHVHEDMRMQKPFFGIYRNTYRLCNRKSIFVSYYLQSRALNCRNGIVVYNALDSDFVLKAQQCDSDRLRTDILFVGALRRFKGIYEFVELSRRMSQYPFTMVVSASPSEVADFVLKIQPPSNLTIYPIQTDLDRFYRRAKIVLQLTHPDKCIETFGLTILEAMTYGIPVIGPDAGGPRELIDHGVSGYLVDPTHIDKIIGYLKPLMTDASLYADMRRAALCKSNSFRLENMIAQIDKYTT